MLLAFIRRGLCLSYCALVIGCCRNAITEHSADVSQATKTYQNERPCPALLEDKCGGVSLGATCQWVTEPNDGLACYAVSSNDIRRTTLLSPAGRLIAGFHRELTVIVSAPSCSEAEVFDNAIGRKALIGLPFGQASVYGVAVSDDGAAIAMSLFSGVDRVPRLVAWSVVREPELKLAVMQNIQLSSDFASAHQCAISSLHKLVFISGMHGVNCYRLDTGDLLYTVPTDSVVECLMALHEKSEQLCIRVAPLGIIIVDLKSGIVKHRIDSVPLSDINVLAMDSSGALLAVAGSCRPQPVDSVVYSMSTDSVKMIAKRRISESQVVGLAFTDDGKGVLARTTQDACVRCKLVEEGKR